MKPITFRKATKSIARCRIGLFGPSGSGKTWTALELATALCPEGKRIAVMDSERGSSAKYANKFDFDIVDPDNFAPTTYVACIKAAEKAGYGVMVIDSLSHAWAGKDGALEQVDMAMARSGGNKFAAWRDVTPDHNAMVDAMLQSSMHIIVTMRSKTEYVVEKNEQGKSVPRKVGLAPVQRDGMEYEFDIVGEMDDATIFISKTRFADLHKLVMKRPGPELGAKIRAWLEDGTPEQAKPSATDTPKPIPMRERVSIEIASWSGIGFKDDAFASACRDCFDAAGVPLNGHPSSDAQLTQVWAWIKARRSEGKDFLDAIRKPEPSAFKSEPTRTSDDAQESDAAKVVTPRVPWVRPPRLSPVHVHYWRDKIIARASGWLADRPDVAAKTNAEELVQQLEELEKLPHAGSGVSERDATQMYRALAVAEKLRFGLSLVA